ncbi:MAG: response regulator [Candidatus Sumerlaeota bacterium]|nr:response regulator [Candidatus Sumerlaeota bacterium]
MAAAAKVMVVNDDDVQRSIIAAVLKKEGYDVAEYSKAGDALRAISTQGAPSLIVTDLYMPEIDGWRFCRLLRSSFYASANQTPILVVSATYSGEHAREITSEMGANAFLPAPIDSVKLAEHARALIAGREPARESNVLIIEDDPITAKILSHVFSDSGYAIRTALTGAEGRRMFHEQTPDVVTLDFHLPDVNGDVLLKEFKSAQPSTVLMMITGDLSPELATRFMIMGADAYLHKPFDSEYLIALCERCCRARALLHVEELLEARSVELRKSEARFRNLFEKMLDAFAVFVVVPDAEGRPYDFQALQINPAFERLMGLSASDVIGKTLREFLSPLNPELMNTLIAIAGAGAPAPYEFFIAATQRHCEGIAYCPEPAQLAMIFADVTERKRAMDLRLQSSRIEATATLAGGIAHRFNNLMTAALGNAQMLLESPPEPSRAHEMLEAIIDSTRQAGELAHTLLAYARGGKYWISDVNLNASVREFMDQAVLSLPIQVRFDARLAPDLWPIRGDAKQISQVISNLCLNAIEAVEDKGEIVIATRNESPSQAAHGSHSDIPPGHYVVLSVSDTGHGMDEQTLSRIFEPFFSTRFMGRGLGLAAVYGIVKNHAGYIDVRANPGQGSTFTVYVPAKEEIAHLRAAQHEAKEPGAQMVLLIEDEEPVANITQQILRKLGYQTLLARNGLQAVEIARTHPGPIHAALLDLAMPLMDGYDAFPLLMEARPNMKILLSSGYDVNPAAQVLLQKGACAFLKKPFTMEALAQELDFALNDN